MNHTHTHNNNKEKKERKNVVGRWMQQCIRVVSSWSGLSGRVGYACRVVSSCCWYIPPHTTEKLGNLFDRVQQTVQR